MIKRFILLILFISVYCFSFSQNPSVEYAKQGMKLFDEGKYTEAIEQYKKGKSLDQKNSLFSYEIALSYFMLKDYPSCITALDSVLSRPDANDQFYQLLGDAYDMTSQPDTALKIYNLGMKKFPKAANLSMESGVVEFTRKNYAAARDYWVNGIIMDPAFAETYYQLAKFYADSANRIPAILYAETYLNLMRNTAQTAEISKLICSLYGKSIQVMKDSTMSLRFSDISISRVTKDSTMNFCDAVTKTYQIVGNTLKEKKPKAAIDAVIMVRETFIKTWFEQKFNLKFPFSLFDFEKQLIDTGHFYSYSQWLLMKCNVFDFQVWYKTNTKTYTDFVDWYKKHPFTVQVTQAMHLCR